MISISKHSRRCQATLLLLEKKLRLRRYLKALNNDVKLPMWWGIGHRQSSGQMPRFGSPSLSSCAHKVIKIPGLASGPVVLSVFPCFPSSSSSGCVSCPFSQHGRTYAWEHLGCSFSRNSRISSVRPCLWYMFSGGVYSNLMFIVFLEPPRCRLSCISRISRMIGDSRSSLCVPCSPSYFYDESLIVIY